jgi:sugar/nucleoside kinase (ribokinase family)
MAQSIDLVIVGHFALDTIIQQKSGSRSQSLGGGVTYGSLSASTFNPKVRIGIVSRIGTDLDPSFLQMFHGRNIDLHGITQQGPYSTAYELTYQNGSNTRKLKLISRAPDIAFANIPEIYYGAKTVHFTPIAHELPFSFFKKMAQRKEFQHTLFGLDVQGVIRRFDASGNMYHDTTDRLQSQIKEILQLYGPRMYFKASEAEVLAVTGANDVRTATEQLAKTRAYVFTTMGKRGLYFKVVGKPLMCINAYAPETVRDETGAGDCFMAVLLVEMAKFSPEERTYDRLLDAIHLAAAAASFLVEATGPAGFQDRTHVVERAQPRNECETNL